MRTPLRLIASLVLALCLASSPAWGAGPAKGASASQEPARLFAADSVWNTPLPDNAPLDPTNAMRMDPFVNEIKSEIKAGIGPWISETASSTPFYIAGARQRRVFVKLDTGSWGNSLQNVLSRGVPIPDNAMPAAGSDAHMTIYQPSTDTLWEFWKAVKKADGWHASWGGVMERVSKSPGYYTNDAVSGLAANDGWHWGSTASSLPVIAGTITIAELRRGRIDHALAIDIPNPCAKTFSWPAQRTDGTLKTPDCVPEGAHLRLDPSLDLSTISMPRMTRMLAEAAQRYGIIVRDKTGHATGFYAEDPTPTGANPYRDSGGFYDGLAPWKFLPQFPWANMQLLRMTACTAAPCPSPAAPKRKKRRKRSRPGHGRVATHARAGAR
jgi:hypothetical protein